MTDANKTGESEAMTLESAKAILAECGVDHRFCSSGNCLAASYFIEGFAAALSTNEASLKEKDAEIKSLVETFGRQVDAQNAERKAAKGLVEAAWHYKACDYPEEVRFRCELCQKADAALAAYTSTQGQGEKNV